MSSYFRPVECTYVDSGRRDLTKFSLEQCFESDPIRPFINLCDLKDGFDKIMEEPDRKRQVLRVLDMKYKISYTFTLVLGLF